MRVDVWDVGKDVPDAQLLDCGYPKDFDDLFVVDGIVGKGGFGEVRVVVEKASGEKYACKSIKKRLNIPNVSADKQAQHIDNIEREIKILKRLRGTLSVVQYKGAWEDDADLHIVMEYCSGGELHHTIGRRAYTEGTVAGYMRSVLHTLAQCHSHRILHRDVKPGNFMLLSDEEDAPLKAIDFGLAVFFDPGELPRTDLGLDGTPWFMAPETLSSQTFPASDLWSAGVMAYQLLSGYLPFDDHRNPSAPALSLIWKGILNEAPSFRRSAWAEVSAEAKDFVEALLQKDPAKRPTAKEALRHPWLQTGFHDAKRRPLSATVVQRIQRFAQANVLRRTILELIASELLKVAPPRLSSAESSLHGASAFAVPAADPSLGRSLEDDKLSQSFSPPGGDGSAHSGGVFPMSPDAGSMLNVDVNAAAHMPRAASLDAGPGLPMGRSTSLHGPHSLPRSPSVQAMATLARAASRSGAATVHGPGDYWRIMRQASELAAIGSGHGQFNYLRAAPRSQEERQEQRKAARLSLDTSAHGGDRYHQLLQRLDSEPRARKLPAGMRTSQSMGALSASAPSARLSPLSTPSEAPPAVTPPAAFPPAQPSAAASRAEAMDIDTLEKGGRGRSAALSALQAGAPVPAGIAASPPRKLPKKVSFLPPTEPEQPAAAVARSPAAQPSSAVPILGAPRSEAVGGPASDGDGSAHGAVTNPQELEALMRRMSFRQGQGLSKEAMAEGLRRLGYDLAPSEVGVLVQQLDMDADSAVEPSEFVASQLDWGALQRRNADLWLELAGRAFAGLDQSSRGRLRTEDLVASLRAKLPAAEVDFAVEDAMVEAGYADADEIDFEAFLKMLHVGSFDSLDSLDQFDPRLRRSVDLDASVHGGPRLESVPEDAAPRGP